jgi:hypothetical protein
MGHPMTPPIFREPEIVWREACEKMSGIPNPVLFNSSQYRPLTEAWCAGVFGMGYSLGLKHCAVAVNDADDDTDFLLRVASQIFRFQTVEAQEPTRRRGKEHRDFAAGRVEYVPYEPEKGFAEGPRWIANKVTEKAAKKYARAKQLSLLVYANFNARNIQYDALVNLTAPS